MVTRKIIISLAAAATLGIAVPAVTNVAQAFDMGNMMYPGRWFDDDDDRYGGRYGRYGYGGGPYGWGGGPYGWGGGPYGWGGGPYGWGGGPYGYGGYGGQPSTIVVNPSSDSKPAPKLPE
jgi:hypothetical protein